MTTTDPRPPRFDVPTTHGSTAHGSGAPPPRGPQPALLSTEEWERPDTRPPLVRWRPAGAALVLLLIVAAAWWAVSWLTSPAPPSAPGASPAAAVATEGATTSAGRTAPAEGATGETGAAASTESSVGSAGGPAGTKPAGQAGQASGETATVRVHVVGEVRRPGVVEVPADARVEDAVRAAGGTTRAARTERINLAAPVQDGQQVLIPDVRTEPDEAAGGAAGVGTAPRDGTAGSGPGGGHDAGSAKPASVGEPGAGGAVDLNTADADTLETLPGVGPATAEKIIAHRESVGPFTGLQDLDAVPGIGPASLQRLRDHVTW